MPARCGVQKKRAILRSRAADMTGCARWRAKVLICRGADGRGSVLDLRSPKWKCADVQMHKQASTGGAWGKQLYIRIRAHTHARMSCILRRNCVHSALTMRFYLIINVFRCVDRWNFHLHGNCTRLMWRCKHNYGREDLRDRERKSLVHPTEFSIWHDRNFCLPLQKMQTLAC